MFSHPVYLFLREFSLQDSRGGSRVPAARLHGHTDRYKIKLRASGYRLVYQVIDEKIVLLVIAVGKRESSEVYQMADIR
ncbi:type II toxin-antitoxin system RelE/ParE family toxin [Escherichia coli]|uniref:type II toxin-antitoxin system RelE family toxin n=1 Tax=Escherichia coli TaxID=562 RepID=UPI002852EE02|nr:type II toxin-antitoxin system RelE/ParE family toxin [Escherichia coli]